MRRLSVAVAAFAFMALSVAHAGSEPRCFGAASRDHVKRCHNPKLLRMVRPTPAQALLRPNAACRVPRRAYPLVCEFGAPENTAYKRIALIGDSHATHWRAALGPVAEDRGWAGFSLTRAGCSLSASVPRLRENLTQECLQWRAAVHGWLLEHPGVETVVVSQHRAHVKGGFEAEVAGYLEAWRALPETVSRIVVIRDTPVRPSSVRRCVVAAIARRLPAGRVCAVPRGAVLRPDPAAVAAQRYGSRRVKLVDMSRYFCSASHCFPVVGGVLVHKDHGHMTAAFGRTLAPYLRASLRGV
jgi:hypothetical protein